MSIASSRSALPALEGHTAALSVGGPAPATPAPGPGPKAPEGPSFGQVLKAFGDEARRGEALVDRAARGGGGRDLAPAELIALQAGVYRWVETVDLASKLVDRITQAAKTVTQPGSG